MLHSFVTEKEEDVFCLAGSLVNVLENCGQDVPGCWRNMSDGSNLSCLNTLLSCNFNF